jgi:KUP system potassium uptake protein
MDNATTPPAPHPRGFATLLVGAIGVVFGDIGTSPLYALKESLGGHGLPLDRPHVLAVLSLIFWSIMLVVTLKYVALVLRADNRGEGGSLALLALNQRLTRGGAVAGLVVGLGLAAAGLFYGDAIITPAISVLSAVEGLQLATPALKPYVVPLTLAILVALFAVQSRGTATMGAFFGPITLLWFATLAVLGATNILRDLSILAALDPRHGLRLFASDGWLAFLVMGSVFLAVTGAEALYADMGHFGRAPIRAGWLAIVLPALVLNYFGQGALVLADPSTIENPFYRMAPEWALLPLIALATAATIIASQATISGAFSITRQAVQLGFLPRLRIVHTSAGERGQIYIPAVNWALLVSVCGLVLGFQTSSNLAAAYGIAVSGTMAVTTLQLAVVAILAWRWPSPLVIGGAAALFALDMAFFLSNATKIASGGWFALLVGLLAFVLLTTWRDGRALVRRRQGEDAAPIESVLRSEPARGARIAGTAVFMTNEANGAPTALLHNLKHNRLLHARVLLLTVRIEEDPYISAAERADVAALGGGFHRIVLRYGFMDAIDVAADLAKLTIAGEAVDPQRSSFFLSRVKVTPSPQPGMALWRERLFRSMTRNASDAGEFFRLPHNRVIELGAQIAI